MAADRDFGAEARNYRDHGCALLARLIDPEWAAALTNDVMRGIRERSVNVHHDDSKNLLSAKAVSVYSDDHPPLDAFQAELTPAIAAIAGCALVPTYSYFRIYPRDAICRVHADRPACEHSVSLMLTQAGGVPWPLDVAAEENVPGKGGMRDDFGGDAHVSLPMAAGDAVIYRGITRRHGRVMPNPNAWSAHLFLHWVDPQGPYAEHAHDRQARAGERHANLA